MLPRGRGSKIFSYYGVLDTVKLQKLKYEIRLMLRKMADQRALDAWLAKMECTSGAIIIGLAACARAGLHPFPVAVDLEAVLHASLKSSL